MISNRVLGFTIATTIFVLMTSCGYPEQPRKTFGPKETTDIVIIFKKGVSQDVINDFEEHVISVPHESGHGTQSLPGIGSGYQFDKDNYKGMGINFKVDATIEQRENVKARILGSDIVFHVYENARPDNLGDLK